MNCAILLCTRILSHFCAFVNKKLYIFTKKPLSQSKNGFFSDLFRYDLQLIISGRQVGSLRRIRKFHTGGKDHLTRTARRDADSPFDLLTVPFPFADDPAIG